MPDSDLSLSLNGEYAAFLHDLKARIQTAQVRAALAVNRELVLLYWQMGRAIDEKQQQHGWGAEEQPPAVARQQREDDSGRRQRNEHQRGPEVHCHVLAV